MAYYNIKYVKDFAVNTGISESSLSRQLNCKTAINYDTLLSILRSYPEISAEWLMRGEGEMIKRNGVLAEPNATYNVLDFVIACKDSSTEELDAAEKMIESIKVLQHKKYQL